MIVFKTQQRLTVLSAHAAVKHRQWGNQTNLEVCQNQSPVKIARTQNTSAPSSLSPFSSENSRRQTETSLSPSRSLSISLILGFIVSKQKDSCDVTYFILS